MYKYTALNVSFLIIASLAVFALQRYKNWKIDLRTLAAMLALTAVFDSLLIAIGIFAYRPEHILGLYVGKAPIEDFAYTLAAALTMPLLWRKLRKNYEK